MNNLFDVSGKVALVTGGSRGIGEMIAEGFVANGVKTYISARKAEACDATAAEAFGAGRVHLRSGRPVDSRGHLSARGHDQGTRGQAGYSGQQRRGDLGCADRGVSRGGLGQGHGHQRQVAIFPDPGAACLCSKMRRRAEDPARIIMVGSIDGLGVNRLPTFSYGPSKAAVHHLTRTLASHLASRNITVNAVAPGPFPSKMMAHTLDTMGEQIKKGVPLGRIGEPGDMAGAAIYLSSKASSYVTGVVIPVDGGIVGAAGTL